MGQAESFRRAKSGVLERGPIRPHWGPEREENWDCCGSAAAPGFAEPTVPVRILAGACYAPLLVSGGL